MEPIVFQPKVKRKYLLGTLFLLGIMTLLLVITMRPANLVVESVFLWEQIPRGLLSLTPFALLLVLYISRMNVKRIEFTDVIIIHRWVGMPVTCDTKNFRYREDGLYVLAKYTLYTGAFENSGALHSAFQTMADKGLLELRQPSGADIQSRKRRTAIVWSVIIPVSVLMMVVVIGLEVSETMIAIAGLAYLIIVSICFSFMWKGRPLN